MVWICLLVLLFIFIYFENNIIQMSFFEVSSKKLPSSFENYTIVHISDLHNKKFGKNQNRLLKKIYNQSPDIIFITGDIIDKRNFNTKNVAEFIKGAVRLAPVYFVPGNHEASIKENYKILYEKLSLFGVNIINNECIKLFLGKDSICICGIDDPCFVNERGLSKKEVIENNLSKIKIDIAEFNILLSHRPEMIKVYASYGYDLVFTGHAHGGQFRIPFIGGIFAPNQVFFPKYTSGKHVVSHTVEIISRGLGPSIIPIRIFNRPEIVVCKLKSIK